MDSVPSRELRLGLAHLREPQVIEAQVAWKMRLIVPGEQRARLRHVAPLGESRAPPFVVFRNGMELGKVEGDGADVLLAQGNAHSCDSYFDRNLHSKCLSASASDFRRALSIAP